MQINCTSIAFKGIMDPNVLVTGASGYIGSNLVHNLTEKGYNCIVNTRNPDKVKYLKKIVDEVNKTKTDKSLCTFVNLDLLDTQGIRDVLTKNAPIDAVVHLAGATLNAESLRNPRKYYENNVGLTLNLLNSMLDNDVNKIVFISTGSTYGKINYSPVDESHPQEPMTPYSRTKFLLERMLYDYGIHGLRPMILRLFNVAGARTSKDLDIGTNVISVLMNKLKTNSLFTLMGNKYDTRDGTCVKDFLHITDVCNAIRLSIQSLLDDSRGNLYNLGSGEGVSLQEIIDKSQQISGKKLQLRIGDNLPTETPELIVDNKKIRTELGWKPEFNIDDILTSSWNWTQKNGK